MTKRVAIAFNTRDRTEQVKRVVETLLQPDKFDLYWFDGSKTDEGQHLPWTYGDVQIYANCRGGPDHTAVLALHTLLEAGYDYVGLCEDDIFFTDSNWFDRTMELFDIGAEHGLKVGAVSARCYDDRILCQRNGYALMHNLGYGMIIFTRAAAKIFLNHFRTGMTGENRRVFCKLADLDIGKWWTFRENNQPICTDWGVEKFLAMRGLAALALVPSPVEMVGQDPPLEHQGLRVSDRPVEMRRDDSAFLRFVERTALLRTRAIDLGCPKFLVLDNGEKHYYPHQFKQLGCWLQGEWRIKWTFGMGPFSFRAIEPRSVLEMNLAGPSMFTLGGGKTGPARFRIEEGSARQEFVVPDERSDQFLDIKLESIPVGCRRIRITALQPGLTVLRMRSLESQITDTRDFDFTWLPPAEER